MYVVFLKITTFLWIILILHSGHTSLFIKTVTIKFMGARGRGPTCRAESQGLSKTNTLLVSHFIVFFEVLFCTIMQYGCSRMLICRCVVGFLLSVGLMLSYISPVVVPRKFLAFRVLLRENDFSSIPLSIESLVMQTVSLGHSFGLLSQLQKVPHLTHYFFV